MINFPSLCLIYGLLGSLSSSLIAQNNHQQKANSNVETSSGIQTGDNFDGIKYHIIIFPTESTLDKHMPMSPSGKNPEFTVVDQQPIPIKTIQPEYPEKAKREKIEGTVWLKCLVGEDGNVKRTELLRTDADIFVKPAIEAAKQWVFSLGKIKDQFVPVWIAIPFRFKLDK